MRTIYENIILKMIYFKAIFSWFICILLKIKALLVLLFIIYILLFSWVIANTRFFINSGLSKPILILVFLIKVSIAVFFGWASKTHFAGFESNDTWSYYERSTEATKVLMQSPQKYIASFINDPYNNHGFSSLFESKDSYWNTLKDKTFIYFISILNCFTFSNYYINTILFSFLMLFGLIALYKVNQTHFVNSNKILLLFSILLMPSFLFWFSAVSKDAVAFTLTSFIIYIAYFGLKNNHYVFKIILFIFSVLTLFLIKNYILLILIPALFCLIVSKKYQNKAATVFISFYLACSLLFFYGKYIHHSLNFPAYLLDKQTAFLNLEKGGSTIEVDTVSTSTYTFIKQIPEALFIVGFTPTLQQINNPLALLSALEILFFWCILLILFLIGIYKKIKITPYGMFVFFFSITLLLIIGFTNNNIGAIVRYRAFIFPFCMPLIILGISKYIQKRKI